MSFLYTLSNICIPFSLMLYETVKRDSEGLKPSYGKWLALFVLTFFFNGLSIFGKWWITFLDLAIKCSLYFLPESINEKIEEEISSLHLESLIQNGRNYLVNVVFWVHQKSIWIVLKKLRPEEADQFKQALKKSLDHEKSQLTVGITVVPKTLDSTGVNCTIISEAAVAQTLIKREIETKKGDIEKRLSPDSSRRSDRSNSEEKAQQHSLQAKHLKKYQTKSEYKTSSPEELKTKNLFGESFHQMRQSSKIIADDLQEDDSPNKSNRFARQPDPETSRQKSRSKPKDARRIEKETIDNSKNEESKQAKVQKKVVAKPEKKQGKKQVKKELQKKDGKEVEKKESTLKRRHTDISQIRGGISNSRQSQNSPDTKEQVELIEKLEKLDVSASEYSDMFEEDRDDDLDEETSDIVKQVCRVEAIVEIGSAPTSKLEIYYLQLYSNGDLRIMSLYGREFQKHKLISVTKTQNNYYTLHLSGGTVNSRKIKFRGQHQPFMKYLQNI